MVVISICCGIGFLDTVAAVGIQYCRTQRKRCATGVLQTCLRDCNCWEVGAQIVEDEVLEAIADTEHSLGGWNGDLQQGNTGFYDASIRKVKLLSVLWDAVLKECRLKPNLDGQPNFWSALRRLRKSLAPPCFCICRGDAGQEGQCNGTAEEEILDYCEMDPFEHRTGWGHRDDKGPVSYHANFKVGRKPKIAALSGMGVWRPTCT
eukprot:s254_g34.t1